MADVDRSVREEPVPQNFIDELFRRVDATNGEVCLLIIFRIVDNVERVERMELFNSRAEAQAAALSASGSSNFTLLDQFDLGQDDVMYGEL